MSSLARAASVADTGFSTYDKVKAALERASDKMDSIGERIVGNSYNSIKGTVKRVALFSGAYFLLMYSGHIVMGLVGERIFRKSIQDNEAYFADRKVAKIAVTATAIVAAVYLLSCLSFSSLLIVGTFGLGWNWRKIDRFLDDKPSAAASVSEAPRVGGTDKDRATRT